MGVWDSSDLVTQSFAKDSSEGVDSKTSNGARKSEMASTSWIRGDLIGAGAFGKVNLALNRENGELFAVKSIECNERNTSEMLAMKNEVQILSSLDSPFVVKCLGSSFSLEGGKSMHNVFVEYMSGGSLADLMKKFGGHFDEPLIRNYTRSILEGIQYLHAQEIVHCDIKGKNVLVGSSGVKLADFGAAKRMGAGSVVDSQLTMKGTPLWMAPEVVALAEQGPASDIWSLGCTVLEMATGKAPWIHIANGAANPFVALYHIHRSEQVPELPSCLSEQAHDFLRKCFQRDPRVRSTAEQLLKHPFITDSVPVLEEPQAPQPSPTSTLDFPSHHDVTGYTSSIVNSVPILRSPLFAKRASAAPLANFQSEEEPKQSTSSSSGADWWCNSPLSPMPGQWIVVRSPKATSPTSCDAPKLPCALPQEVVAAAAVKECNLPVAALKEVAVEPEFASCATDSLEQLAQSDSAKASPSIVDHCQAGTMDSASASDLLLDDEVMVAEECQATSTSSSGADDDGDDDEVMDSAAAAAAAADAAQTQTQSQGNVRPGVSEAMGQEDEGASPSHTTGLSSSSSSSRRGCSSFDMGRASRSLYNFVFSMARGPTRPRAFKFGSLRATLRKLATAHRKMTSRGRRGKSALMRFSIRKQAHELVFEKLWTLGRSLPACSFRLAFVSGIASYVESLGSLQPQFFRNRFKFLNKSATPWWLLYKIPVFHVLGF
ncbi:mitogen-activated protein kinase kinase kinase 17/18 [Marchantia polymorpha subsp. ruderalis]